MLTFNVNSKTNEQTKKSIIIQTIGFLAFNVHRPSTEKNHCFRETKQADTKLRN